MLNLFLLCVGFVLLIKGADVFVDGAGKIALKLKVPKMLVGLTIVAFGTSAPEFAVSVKALMAKNGDIMLGNVIGSNILNILLILGLAALVGRLKVKSNTVKKEMPILILITLAFVVLVMDRLFGGSNLNGFTRQDGLVLTLMFGIFIYYLVGMARKDIGMKGEASMGKKLVTKGEKSVKMRPKESVMTEILKLGSMTLVGVVGIVIGSNMVVDGASALAIGFGVSQKMVALTVVALGTSLPELVTSVVATRKGEADIAIGNVVGSNIFNIAVVAGLPVVMFGGIPKVTFSYVDLMVMVVATGVLYLFARKDKRIGKAEGAVLLGMFVVYYGYVVATGIKG